MGTRALLALGIAIGAASCGSSPGTVFPEEVAVAPPVAPDLATATFSLG